MLTGLNNIKKRGKNLKILFPTDILYILTENGIVFQFPSINTLKNQHLNQTVGRNFEVRFMKLSFFLISILYTKNRHYRIIISYSPYIKIFSKISLRIQKCVKVYSKTHTKLSRYSFQMS